LASGDGRRLFELSLGPATLAFVAASRPEHHTLMDRIAAQGGSDSFAARWLDACGLGEAADAVRRFDARRAIDAPKPELIAAE
jgi:type IV secretion system protein VirB4